MSWQSLFSGTRVYMERVEPGRVKLTQHVDAHTALRKLARAIQAKQRRGYREIA